MSGASIIAVPSKGRLKEQVEAWLADCGLELEVDRRRARLPAPASRACRARRCGCCRPPTSPTRWTPARSTWASPARTCCASGATTWTPGCCCCARWASAAPTWWWPRRRAGSTSRPWPTWRRWRTTTWPAPAGACGWRPSTWPRPAAFFARHGVADYRIVESGGATEGAPAAGSAELVVDITTTGATLAANGLKVLADGVILKSQAQLAASLRADWTRRGAGRGRAAAAHRRGPRRGADAAPPWPGRRAATRPRPTVVEALVAGRRRRAGPNGLLVDSAQVAGRVAGADRRRAWARLPCRGRTSSLT